ncbi:helix-turn-helix domain-containing protein [Actinokineospora sp.]|uniref:helix-turn-helix domain-containing protein n=1 Tax=Actinokineospora sp. TaxID=1872133 RepID=UPI004037FB89
MTSAAALRWSTEANCLTCQSDGACRSTGTCLAGTTSAARVHSVAKAIDYMHGHLSEPLQLNDVARAGMLSPFHFHRVFREITLTTPARFLTALRMTEARHLLLSTAKSVTEVCTEVGYSSLGTFISQFGRLTGLSPRRFRFALTRIGDLRIGDLGATDDWTRSHGPVGVVGGGLRGCDCALLGMFRLDRAHEWPLAFEVIETDRLARTNLLPDGRYQAVAVGFSSDTTVLDALAAPIAVLGVIGFDLSPLIVTRGDVMYPFHVVLRRQRRFDPPVEVTRALLQLANAAAARSLRALPM